MRKVQKIWLAAVIDCEGSICLAKNKSRSWIVYEECMTIVNSNIDLIRYAMKILDSYKIGVSIQEGPSPGRFGKKKQYRIFIRGQALKKILKELKPYFICKKEITIRLISWLEYKETRRHFSTIQRRADRNHYDTVANWVRELMPNLKLV